MKLKLKKFSMDKIASDKVVVAFGCRGTGKSFLIRDLLYHHQDIPTGTCISATECANRFYGNMVPQAFIHSQYTPELLKKVVMHQKTVMKQMRKEQRKKGHSNIDPRTFIIMDDCLYDNSWTKDTNIREIFMNGRHTKMFFILTSQYPLGIPPVLRTNIDFAFILRENNIGNRKRLYENFAGMFPTLDFFNQVMDACTENYECLVIDNTSKSNKLEDCVFWYKAEDRPGFRLGSSKYWLGNGTESSDEEDTFDPRNFLTKNKVKLNVSKTY
jgi:hypothetical protein